MFPREERCVSTQVGCRLCMTGKSELIREVTSMEILAQVVLPRRLRPVENAVFMGMDELAHNLRPRRAVQWRMVVRTLIMRLQLAPCARRGAFRI